MTAIKILIIEDDPLCIINLKILVEELGYQLIGVVDNSIDAFNLLEKDKPDIILMDIDIKGEKNGIEIAKELVNQSIAIIFITSYVDDVTYKKAKQVGPCGYLVKPFNHFTLESIIEYTVSNVASFHENNSQDNFNGWQEDVILKDYVFIKRNNQLEKVAISDIDFVQSEGNYSIICVGKRKFALKLSLVKVYNFLKKYPFLRVNKRHLLNMDKVDSIDLSNNKVILNENHFSIGRTYKDVMLKKLNKLS